MKRTSTYITIPQPCHESWREMSVTNHGAFCHSCQKEVIDYSVMTDRELIEYLENHQTSCGRFRKDQLDTKLSIPHTHNGLFNWKALLLGILPLIGYKAAQAGAPQLSYTTDQSAHPKKDKKQDQTDSASHLIQVTGRVVDEHDKGIANAAIRILDSTGHKSPKGVMSNEHGVFIFSASSDTLSQYSHRLGIEALGYTTQNITITDEAKQSYTVTLKHNSYILTQTLVMGKMMVKPNRSRKIKTFFRRLLHPSKL